MIKKYIVFNEAQVGKDGREYIKGIKYRIQKENMCSLYLLGNDECLNEIPRYLILGKHSVGDIVIGN